MVNIQPFRAIRPIETRAKELACPPYDVLTRAEATTLAAHNPYSYVQIDHPESTLPLTIPMNDPRVYQQAARELARFQANGWLIKEASPMFYLYEQTTATSQQTGLVTTTAVADFLKGTVKAHEITRTEKVRDRLHHMESCDAQTSPLFLTYPKQAAISSLLADWKETHEPLFSYTTMSQVKEQVWQLDDPAINTRLQDLFSETVPALYIADGHHRAAAAVELSTQKIAQDSLADEAPARGILSVLFPAEELTVLAYNRLLTVDVPTDLLTRLAEHFAIVPRGAHSVTPIKAGTFGLYWNKNWYQLTSLVSNKTAPLAEQLDTALLQTFVFENLFGLRDVRTDPRISFVGGNLSSDALAKMADAQGATLTFTLYPTSLSDIFAIADARQVLPPKSTWFEPKLASGLFLHALETKENKLFTC